MAIKLINEDPRKLHMAFKTLILKQVAMRLLAVSFAALLYISFLHMKMKMKSNAMCLLL